MEFFSVNKSSLLSVIRVLFNRSDLDMLLLFQCVGQVLFSIFSESFEIYF
jgi:hypothetical protein